ncbi:MAG: T9SS type A sorting domain-containing protein, partial [Saprospiraceae bacterium]|nr:T9SS type A sorting domain-containing protein [Saprospiraceae bacterium]
LFLDLDNDGTMETVINSLNPPPPGVVYYGNANTPNFGGGTIRQFDNRGLPLNQNYQFSILNRFNTTGTKKMFSVRWNTQQFPNVYTPAEFPYGTHKIKWFISDGCGNETACEYNFTVRDCKAPTVVCLNGLSANIMPTGMIQLWASDFLQYTEDNCTPPGLLKIAIRKCGEGTGIPTNPDGSLQTSVVFTCADLGTQCVELWSVDAAGNADYCETYVIVQDNQGGCSTDFINVAGELHTEMAEGVEEAMVKIDGTSTFTPPYSFFDLTDATGHYEIMNNIPLDASFTIAPEKTDNPLNGVTTYDLVLISQHILGLQLLDSPYKMIAADANKSGSITTFDILELRKLILGIYTELPNNDSWRFVDNSFVFPNPQNPFESPFPESISVSNAFSNMMQEHFMGIKVGDVNNSAIANVTAQVEERNQGTAIFDLNDRTVVAGEIIEVAFTAAQELAGFQFTLLHPELELLDVMDASQVTAQNFGRFVGKTTVSVNDALGFVLRFRADKPGKLSDLLRVSGEITRAEAYLLDETLVKPARLNVALRFDGKTVAGLDFELYQNQPNPFTQKTMIGFFLPEAAEATLSVLDESGRLVYQQKGQFAQGDNSIVLDRALLNTSGVLYYKLDTNAGSATRKMIQTK